MVVTPAEECLNPYSNGMRIELYMGVIEKAYQARLNPYSNGMRIEHH